MQLVLDDGREAPSRAVEFAHAIRVEQDHYVEFIATGA